MNTQELQPEQIAVIGIDTEACFIPASEGERRGLEGYGELACENGERVVAPLNRLYAAGRKIGAFLASTRDWHRLGTAHFAAEGTEPNFDTTWPVHGVEYTPGAEYDADLELEGVVDYKKGNEIVDDPKDDDSYTGGNGISPEGTVLLEDLVEREIKLVILGGLALNKCVDASARTFIDAGMQVIVASDATEPVFAAQRDEAIADLKAYGVEFQTTDEILAGVLAA